MKAHHETTFGAVFQPWPLKPLPEVAFFQEGPGLRKWQWTESGMKVINVTNILGDGSVDVNNTARFISLEEYESKYRHFAVDAGDIVIASSGNTYGKVGRVNHSHLPVMMNTSVIRFHPADPDKLDQNFLFSFLRSHLFKNQMESFVIGSAQPNFGPSHLKRMVIPCPDITTQRKIAGVLSAYDDLIENNTRRIAVLEEMAQSIYREWFVNFRFPGHEKVKLINSPLGRIPEGCKVVTVEELASHSTEGITPAQYPEEEFAHFSIPNYDKGQLPELETGATIQSNKFVVLSGCVMLSKLNPRIPRIWLPEPYGDYRPVASTEFLIVSPLAPATREFIYYQFQSDDFSGRFRSCSSGTSTSHQRVKPTDFVKLKALLPPSSLIEAFTNHVAPMCRLIHNRRIHNRNLRTTRDLLLPKLISGQLDVEELDIETGEPLVEAEA